MAVTCWLIDKSAPVRLAASPGAAEWAGRIEPGLARITTVTRLEAGYSARSGPDLRAGPQRRPCPACPWNTSPPRSKTGPPKCSHCSPTAGSTAPLDPGLIIAATAELAGLVVLHLDKDFEVIAGITGQPLERLNA